MTSSLDFASSFVKFLNATPTPFHVVREVCSRLESSGFRRLSERDSSWSLSAGEKYFLTRNDSSVVAFLVGGRCKPEETSFHIVGAHTDSPALKLKPHFLFEKCKTAVLSVSPYGGGIWRTWFDRDLGIAGRILVSRGPSDASHATSCLSQIARPVARIPSLAIHLDRSAAESFSFNAEEHLTAVLSSSVASISSEDVFAELLGNATFPKDSKVVDFDLQLFDVQPAVIGGFRNEFVFSGRLDNLCSVFSSTESLRLRAADADSLRTSPDIDMIAFFDNEECGSESEMGAASSYLPDVLSRICDALSMSSSSQRAAALSRSFVVSFDNAHAVHPNYSEKHHPLHRPEMNGGVVLKRNSNMRYSTTGLSAALLKSVAEVGGVPLQEFVVRSDSSCGSTIGPSLASRLGVRSVDIGIPQLSMHSIREQCGVDDVLYGRELLTAFFRHFREIDEKSH